MSLLKLQELAEQKAAEAFAAAAEAVGRDNEDDACAFYHGKGQAYRDMAQEIGVNRITKETE